MISFADKIKLLGGPKDQEVIDKPEVPGMHLVFHDFLNGKKYTYRYEVSRDSGGHAVIDSASYAGEM